MCVWLGVLGVGGGCGREGPQWESPALAVVATGCCVVLLCCCVVAL